jgi:hypothetical protein
LFCMVPSAQSVAGMYALMWHSILAWFEQRHVTHAGIL